MILLIILVIYLTHLKFGINFNRVNRFIKKKMLTHSIFGYEFNKELINLTNFNFGWNFNKDLKDSLKEFNQTLRDSLK